MLQCLLQLYMSYMLNVYLPKHHVWWWSVEGVFFYLFQRKRSSFIYYTTQREKRKRYCSCKKPDDGKWVFHIFYTYTESHFLLIYLSVSKIICYDHKAIAVVVIVIVLKVFVSHYSNPVKGINTNFKFFW